MTPTGISSVHVEGWIHGYSIDVPRDCCNIKQSPPLGDESDHGVGCIRRNLGITEAPCHRKASAKLRTPREKT